MKKVGMVGGIGPESTLEYYQGIIDRYRKKSGGENYPHIVIDSLNLTEMYNLAGEKNWELFTQRLGDSVKNLAAAGADFAFMAANTAHIVFDEVAKRSSVPLISIVEETCRFAASKNCERVVIFGTAFTMSSGLYEKAFEKYGITALVPSSEDQQVIHNIIFPHLQDGIVVPEEKKTILKIANRMCKECDGDALVLGCTELPLIIRAEDLDVTVLDTTKIHIDAIVEKLIK